MLAKLWEGVGEGLAEKWLAQLGPAFMFWFGGLYFWLGWQGLIDLSKTLQTMDILQQITLISGALLLIITSATVVQKTNYPILRFLEGYWPFFLAPLENWKVNYWSQRIQSDLKTWGELQSKIDGGRATRFESRQAAFLDLKLHYLPADSQDYMPTELGNILRTAETTPRHVYGLDAVVCWPHLWPLLPDTLRQGLRALREQLDQISELWIWGMLFFLWTRYSFWAIPIGLMWAWMAYRMSLNVARSYADLIVASFHMYRFDLYELLHLDLPANNADEKELGDKVTEYLWRGSAPKDGWQFKHPS